MWALKNLLKWASETQAGINGKWVPARPMNGTREYATWPQRFRDAWAVFWCRAEAFTWPEGQ